MQCVIGGVGAIMTGVGMAAKECSCWQAVWIMIVQMSLRNDWAVESAEGQGCMQSIGGSVGSLALGC